MKILIIEDEPRAANQLQKVLGLCTVDYELLDIIDSVEESINWIKEHPQPDLIFMDIQLGDGLSFEIFKQVEVKSPIIFTTAFDQYAIKAFKVNSIDYLLKPIKQVDLQAAIDKHKNLSTQNNDTSTNSISSLIELIEKRADKRRTGILVKDRSGFVQIKIKDIQYLYSSDSITFAITNSKRYIVDETLDQFLSTVSEDDFFRINRGQAVQKSSIIRLEPYFNHRLKLIVQNDGDREFVVSRQRSSEFKHWLNK